MRGSSINTISEVAMAMFNCLHAMHDNGYVFIAVKPKNFMLTLSSLSNTREEYSHIFSSVSTHVRLIDFGLVEPIGDTSTSKHHKDMYPNAPLASTPSYASLNVLEGHTLSQRNDLRHWGTCYVFS